MSQTRQVIDGRNISWGSISPASEGVALPWLTDDVRISTDSTNNVVMYKATAGGTAGTWKAIYGSATGDVSAAHVLLDRNDTTLFPNGVNLGALTTGILYQTVSAGVATMSIAVAGTHFSNPIAAGAGIRLSGTNPITITNRLSEGVAGGQSAYGGTAAGETLTIYGSAHASNGPVAFPGVTGGTSISVGAGNIVLTAGSGNQQLQRSGGSLSVGTLSNDTLQLYANAGAPQINLNASGAGGVDISTLTAGGIVSAAVTTGRLGLVTIGAGLSFVGGTLSATAVTLTAGTGITFVGGTAVTSNLSTGIAGGQTAYGGTAASEVLTLRGTSHGTNGKVVVTGVPAAASLEIANGELLFSSSGTYNFIRKTGGGNLYIGVDSDHELYFYSNTGGVYMIFSSTRCDFSALTAGGMVKAGAGTGRLSIGVAGTDYVAALAAGAGIRLSGTSTITITNRLSEGLAGGQNVYGGTAAGEGLFLYGSIHASNGPVAIVGKSGQALQVMTGQIQVPDGTAGAPSYAFTNATGDGMYYNGSNVLAWSTSGTARMALGSGGLYVVSAGSYASPSVSLGAGSIGLYGDASGVLGLAGQVLIGDGSAYTNAIQSVIRSGASDRVEWHLGDGGYTIADGTPDNFFEFQMGNKNIAKATTPTGALLTGMAIHSPTFVATGASGTAKVNVGSSTLYISGPPTLSGAWTSAGVEVALYVASGTVQVHDVLVVDGVFRADRNGGTPQWSIFGGTGGGAQVSGGTLAGVIAGLVTLGWFSS